MLLPLTTPLLTPTDLEDVGLCVFFLEFLLGVYHINVGNLRNQEGSSVGFYCGQMDVCLDPEAWIASCFNSFSSVIWFNKLCFTLRLGVW
ncbi:hypothetical protein NC651_011961 [Populus alba x Populus x berolinensis]|nr:hypothetical protein NC651_011961 [Populus alba x Populus x berolinensis]